MGSSSCGSVPPELTQHPRQWLSHPELVEQDSVPGLRLVVTHSPRDEVGESGCEEWDPGRRLDDSSVESCRDPRGRGRIVDLLSEQILNRTVETVVAEI